MTQRELILAHLKSGCSITPLEALERYGCFRLAAVIEVLRKENFNIETKIAYNNNKHYAEYKLVKNFNNELFEFEQIPGTNTIITK